MSGVVIHDHVDRDTLFFGDGGVDGLHELVDGLHELEELLMPMAVHTLADHFAGLHIERTEQAGGAVADVIVRVLLGIAQSQWQSRLRTIEHLNLALLVDGEHDRPFRWIYIKTHNITDCLNK